MLVFIDNTPGDIRLVEIRELLGGRQMQEDYKIHRSSQADEQDRHFILVRADIYESAEELIGELNDKPLKGTIIEARHFVKRNEKSVWPNGE